MAIILFNPTNEEMKTQYIGEDVVLAPGSKVRVDDARGRHVLNVLGPRGLMTLEYGDEGEHEERKARQGRERNMEFKRKNVMNFNTMNDDRAQKHQGYITPTPTLKEYSRELGIKLFEPYSSSDDAMKVHADLKQKLDEKDRELKSKDDAVATLQAQVAQLTQMVGKVLGAKAAAADPTAQSYWSEFAKKTRSINGKHFHNWVADNWNEITTAPTEVQEELADKYQRLYAMPFPTSELEARTVAQQVAA